VDEPIVAEDENGWLGSADLIVSCAVPAFSLLAGPRSGVRADLVINSSPDAIMRFSYLGLRLAVFVTGFEDDQRLLVCRKNGCDTLLLYLAK